MRSRSLLRDGGGADPAERVLPNHLGNVRVVTLDLLELRLHDPHLVCRLLLEKKKKAPADQFIASPVEHRLPPQPSRGSRLLNVDEFACALLPATLGGR